MPTENRRVATYLPKELDERFSAFKAERGLNGDSSALIAILSEFLGVSQQVAHESSLGLMQRIEALEAGFGELKNELLSRLVVELPKSPEMPQSLLDRIQAIDVRLSNLESAKATGTTLSTGELAKRLGIDSSTLSHWKSTGKKGKSLDELLKATREKDPDGIGWSVIPESGKFKPERELLSSSSNSVLQGSLLNAELSDQVNPLPEGSERSGEG